MVLSLAKLIIRGAVIGTSSVFVGLKVFSNSSSSQSENPNSAYLVNFLSSQISKKFTSAISSASKSFDTTEAKSSQEIDEDYNGNDDKPLHKRIEEYSARIHQLEKELEKQQNLSESFKNQLIMRNESIENDKYRSKQSCKSPIEMYSDILDYLSEFHSNFQLDDHLPRVIVVGDQSAGKTSVLEMLIQARIFPRGSGQMTTKSPIQVTLSDGPDHFAKFKDSKIKYNLKSETDLKNLRQEISTRMEHAAGKNKSVSDKTIFLDIQGPGLKKMILVDLPGLINTVTTELADSTKKDIELMVKKHISNPNAIILCIQDGAVDAERSSVTQIVSDADLEGERTIFVLNKADLAEKHLSSRTVTKILNGQLFPMKSQAYFALVSGTNDPNSSIAEITKFEDSYFKKSKFYKGLDDSQKKSCNLSNEVSKCFWKVVKSTINSQTALFAAIQQNLEIEWLNKYNGQLELDRDAMFNRVKAKLLDNFNNLYEIPKSCWISKVKNKIEQVVLECFVMQIFIPSCFDSNIDKFRHQNSYDFGHKLDLKLNNVLKDKIPTQCIKECQKIIINEYNCQIQNENNKGKDNSYFSTLIENISEEMRKLVHKNYTWMESSANYLKLMLENHTNDKIVLTNQEWEDAASRASDILQETFSKSSNDLKEFLNINVLKSNNIFDTQSTKLLNAIYLEIDNYSEINTLNSLKIPPSNNLASSMKKNIEKKMKIEINEEIFKEIWNKASKMKIIKHFSDQLVDCQTIFAFYKTGHLDSIKANCDSLVAFRQIFKISDLIGENLISHLMAKEIKRVENSVRNSLDLISEDLALKAKLLNHPKIVLAEKLKIVRNIRSKLDELMEVLDE